MEPENLTYSILGLIHPISGHNYYKIIVKDDDNSSCWLELMDGPIFSDLDHARIFVAAFASDRK